MALMEALHESKETWGSNGTLYRAGPFGQLLEGLDSITSNLSKAY